MGRFHEALTRVEEWRRAVGLAAPRLVWTEPCPAHAYHRCPVCMGRGWVRIVEGR